MSTWGYGKNEGPETWTSNFDAARGKRQSPIDIITANAKFDNAITRNPLKVTMDKNKMEKQMLHFTGHNFKVDTPDEPSTVSGGPTNDVYKMAQYHFHWGQTDDSVGSEHLIDGKWWPSELHLVHYNTTKYESFSQAADKSDGLLVLGIFLQIGPVKHVEINNLLRPLSTLKSKKSIDLKAENVSVDLTSFLPQDTSKYYTYPGSLTTPPCYESVTWVVFEQPITIGSDQLHHFRQVHDGDSCETTENYRPVCPLYGRVVSKSFN